VASDTNFCDQVNLLSEQTIELCYHCHKCTAGCPAAGSMTYGPDRILRLVQLGEKERLLASSDIWLCTACATCGTRCPNEIDIARVMDALRQMAVTGNVAVGEPDALRFHRLFLALTRQLGRMHEATLLGVYKLWTRHILADLNSGAKMFIKGKIHMMPHTVKGRKELKRIFERTRLERDRVS
jgi:heterodisulfide reductase subunit C